MEKTIAKIKEATQKVTAQKENIQGDTIQKETEVISINTSVMEFVNKLVISGEPVENTPKKVEVTINGKKLNFNCKYIPDDSIASAYINSFKVPVSNKDVQVFYAKADGVLCGCIYIDGKLEYSCIAMQGIFSIIQACFGVNKLITDKLYIASNINRKKPPEPITKLEDKETIVQ